MNCSIFQILSNPDTITDFIVGVTTAWDSDSSRSVADASKLSLAGKVVEGTWEGPGENQ